MRRRMTRLGVAAAAVLVVSLSSPSAHAATGTSWLNWLARVFQALVADGEAGSNCGEAGSNLGEAGSNLGEAGSN